MLEGNHHPTEVNYTQENKIIKNLRVENKERRNTQYIHQLHYNPALCTSQHQWSQFCNKKTQTKRMYMNRVLTFYV